MPSLSLTLKVEPVNLTPISGLLASGEYASREALILKEPTKIVDKLSVNSRCNSIYKKLISTPFVLCEEKIKNKKYKFRTVHPKSCMVGATTNVCVASDFTTRQ